MSVTHQFQTLDKLVESGAQLCKNKASVEVQVGALLSVCEELQHILRYAFIENGFLANRIEGLMLHHKNSVDQLERRIKVLETERKISQRQIKKLRKGITALNGTRKVEQDTTGREGLPGRCSDYDSLRAVSHIAGAPDFDYLLRLNQVMTDFVRDDQNELCLPLMGSDERNELSKLAALYKVRVRCGKNTTIAPVVLVKGRNTSLPAAGEVNSLLANYSKIKHSESEYTSGASNEKKPTATNKADSSASRTYEAKVVKKESEQHPKLNKTGSAAKTKSSLPTATTTKPLSIPSSSLTTTGVKTNSDINFLNLLSATNKQSTTPGPSSLSSQTPQVALLYSNPPSSLQSLGQKAIPIIIRRTSPNAPPVIQISPTPTSIAASKPLSQVQTSSTVECAKINDTSALVNILAQQLIGKDIHQIQTGHSKSPVPPVTGRKRTQDSRELTAAGSQAKKPCESTADEEFIKVD